MIVDPIPVLLRTIELLDELEISYVVGGSVASSILGEPRATLDADLVIRLAPSKVRPLVDAFHPEFYPPLFAMREHAPRSVGPSTRTRTTRQTASSRRRRLAPPYTRCSSIENPCSAARSRIQRTRDAESLPKE